VPHEPLSEREIVQVAKLLQPNKGRFDLVWQISAPVELSLHLGA
jgi:hypothetical protein